MDNSADGASPRPAVRVAPNGVNDVEADRRAVLARWMPLLRSLGYDTDHRTGSVLLALLRRLPNGLEDAVEGLAHLRDTGQLERSHGIARGDPLHLRVLYGQKKPGAVHIMTRAIEAHRKRDGPRPTGGGNGMATVGEILNRQGVRK